MPSTHTAAEFMKRLDALRSPEELRKYHRYFTFDESEQGAGDRFIGVRMGQVFGLAKEFVEMVPEEIERLLESPIHEARAGGCSIMDKQARSRRTTAERRKELYDLYIRRHDRIDNWDLVDLCCVYVVGGYLFDKPRRVLYRLARSKNTWERRTAIVSTAYFMRRGDLDDAFAIAEMLLKDREDLIHKATGWMLRMAGGKDRARLERFLDQHAAAMPRAALRNAIEHLDPDDRKHYLGMKKAG